MYMYKELKQAKNLTVHPFSLKSSWIKKNNFFFTFIVFSDPVKPHLENILSFSFSSVTWTHPEGSGTDPSPSPHIPTCSLIQWLIKLINLPWVCGAAKFVSFIPASSAASEFLFPLFFLFFFLSSSAIAPESPGILGLSWVPTSEGSLSSTILIWISNTQSTMNYLP